MEKSEKQTEIKYSCSGQYYNFKKGTEICAKKENCDFYNKDHYNHLNNKEKITFNKINDFRFCSFNLNNQ